MEDICFTSTDPRKARVSSPRSSASLCQEELLLKPEELDEDLGRQLSVLCILLLLLRRRRLLLLLTICIIIAIEEVFASCFERAGLNHLSTWKTNT